MPLTPDQTFFIKVRDLLGVAEGQRETVAEQQRVLEEVLGGMTDEQKEEIRQGMSFKVKKRGVFGGSQKSMAKGGQLDELDPEEAKAHYKALSPEDKKKSDEAWKKVVDGYLAKLKDAKHPKTGKPLFGDPHDPDPVKAAEAQRTLSQELFEPLVREGVIPEWAVPGIYSKTQRYLDATYDRYKKTLEEERQNKVLGRAKTEVNFHGAGNKRDMLSGLGGKLGNMADDMLGTVIGGTLEEKKRKLGIVSATFSFGMATAGAVTSGMKLLDGRSEALAEKSMNYGQDNTTATYAKLGNSLSSVLPPELVMPIMEALDKADNQGILTYIKEGVGAPIDLIKGSLETIFKGLDVGTQGKIIDAVSHGLIDAAIEREAVALVGKIDGALEEALAKVSPAAGAAVSGAFGGAVNAGQLATVLCNAKDADAGPFVDGLADGLEDAIVSSLPDDEVFASVGRTLKANFLSRAKADAFGKSARNDKTIGAAFTTLFAAARGAIASACAVKLDDGDSDAEPTGVAKEFQKKLGSPDVQKAMLKNVVASELDQPEEIEEQTREEELEYECVLTLVDEGGEMAALQMPIEKLIAQLEQGQMIIDLVNKLGGTILNAASSGVSIAKSAVDAAAGVMTKAGDMMGNEVLPVLKAAKLILRLSLQVTLFAQRLKLWNKFRVQAGRAMKAGSPLSPAIQGFYDNKKEQIYFRSVEQAALAVQIAGAVCESTHEPHAMAAGKAVSAIGSLAEAGNTLTEVIHNERMLRQGWNTTKAALKNPANRKLGLKALMINPTLAMHAIAWAAKEERDPTARDFLKSCGVGENALDVGASEGKIRDYLTTLLYDDRKFLDPEKIKTNWQPSPVELTKASWSICVLRAQTKATPKLGKSVPGEVSGSLSKLDAQASYLKPLLAAAGPADLDKLLDSAAGDHVGKLAVAEAAATALANALDGYDPRAEDGTAHDDMQLIVAQFSNMAEDRKIILGGLVSEARSRAGQVPVTNDE